MQELRASEVFLNFVAFIKENEKELPKETVNKLRFARSFAKVSELRKFLDRVAYEDGLNELKENPFLTYSELFGKLDRYYIRRQLPYLLKSPGPSIYATGDENQDRIESVVEKVVDSLRPYGLGWDDVYREFNSDGSVSIYTAFNETGDTFCEEEILLIDFYKKRRKAKCLDI